MQAKSQGEQLKVFKLQSLQLYADGILESVYEQNGDGTKPSLDLKIKDQLRIHAGGRIEASIK